MIEVNFCVKLYDEVLGDGEVVLLIGDHECLGEWEPNRAIYMTNNIYETNQWWVSLKLPSEIIVRYRYFIGIVDSETSLMLVRRWESSVKARTLNISTQKNEDIFGYIDGSKREVQRGWLNCGCIVQLQLFPDAVQISSLCDIRNVRIKVQPVEVNSLQPILPTASAYTEYVCLTNGSSMLRMQPEFGVPYSCESSMIFHTTLVNLDKVAFLIKVYSEIPASNVIRLLGYQHIFPNTLVGSEGKFLSTLVSPDSLTTVATIAIDYLIILPTKKAHYNFRTSFSGYWQDTWNGLDVGHRGLGRTFHRIDDVPPHYENTLASMKAARDRGADMVEFDIVLTMDLIPIVYHDYTVKIFGGRTPEPSDPQELKEIPIKDLTYEQLKNLKTFHVIDKKIIECPPYRCVKQDTKRLFPTLKDFLTKIDRSLGFDVEIKWPQEYLNGEFESCQTIDKNLYLDRILDVMCRYACGRLIILSSFDANICTMLRFKQNMYPVMFVAACRLRPETAPEYADPRTQSIMDILNTAQAFEFAGIVPNAIHVEKEPGIIHIAHCLNKRIFIWGNALCDANAIESFKKHHPDGLIYDRVDLLMPEKKKNMCERDLTLLPFLQQQCATEAIESTAGPPTTEI